MFLSLPVVLAVCNAFSKNDGLFFAIVLQYCNCLFAIV